MHNLFMSQPYLYTSLGVHHLLLLLLQTVTHPTIASKAIIAINKDNVWFLDVKTKVRTHAHA